MLTSLGRSERRDRLPAARAPRRSTSVTVTGCRSRGVEDVVDAGSRRLGGGEVSVKVLVSDMLACPINSHAAPSTLTNRWPCGEPTTSSVRGFLGSTMIVCAVHSGDRTPNMAWAFAVFRDAG